ncbi:TIGR04222 domain-containing membrane protein [Erythrobacter tepidarius]|uniref:TIGR04222 domain-containing membrane protein n=1 Tax=Erythrobacter tepidarius TaxID=60454 RepID=UPI001302B9DB|nr:TIGR04222 domain-containing membrane protein [Erythrobacter tepidarius]
MQLFSSWTGSSYLLFYAALLGLATLAAWLIPVYLRRPGRRSDSPDAESLAHLAGGRERFVDVLLADLFLRGGLAAGEGGKLVVADPRLPASPAGCALLAFEGPLTREQARAVLAPHADRLLLRLRHSGLMLRPEEVSRLRWLSAAPLAVLLVMGFYRERAGSTLGEPTGLLIALMGLTALIALIRILAIDPRTRAGIAEVAQRRTALEGLDGPPRADEVPMAVALLGTEVLVGTPWEPIHALRQQGGSGSR